MAIFARYSAAMTWGSEPAERAVDCAAAAVFAAAVAYSASIAASVLLGVLMAPLAFALALAGLARFDGERRHQLADFDLPAIAPPAQELAGTQTVVRLFGPGPLAIARPPTHLGEDHPDAAEALSDALAVLKQSLR